MPQIAMACSESVHALDRMAIMTWISPLSFDSGTGYAILCTPISRVNASDYLRSTTLMDRDRHTGSIDHSTRLES